LARPGRRRFGVAGIAGRVGHRPGSTSSEVGSVQDLGARHRIPWPRPSIVATGGVSAVARLEQRKDAATLAAGVSACATFVNGSSSRDREDRRSSVAGDTAFEEAGTLLSARDQGPPAPRREAFRASKIMVERGGRALPRSRSNPGITAVGGKSSRSEGSRPASLWTNPHRSTSGESSRRRPVHRDRLPAPTRRPFRRLGSTSTRKGYIVVHDETGSEDRRRLSRRRTSRHRYRRGRGPQAATAAPRPPRRRTWARSRRHQEAATTKPGVRPRPLRGTPHAERPPPPTYCHSRASNVRCGGDRSPDHLLWPYVSREHHKSADITNLSSEGSSSVGGISPFLAEDVSSARTGGVIPTAHPTTAPAVALRRRKTSRTAELRIREARPRKPYSPVSEGGLITRLVDALSGARGRAAVHDGPGAADALITGADELVTCLLGLMSRIRGVKAHRRRLGIASSHAIEGRSHSGV